MQAYPHTARIDRSDRFLLHDDSGKIRGEARDDEV
jgi:hypothetical protein